MAEMDKYRNNLHSQNGEDGILQELCRRLKINSGSFVEFGAWDGKHLSNTYNLLLQGWSGVYIEGDPAKYKDLVTNMSVYGDKVESICAYVQPQGANTLDNLLSPTRLASNFEVLSIDIDSDDWSIWASLKKYSPLIVVIEINSGIEPGILHVHRSGRSQGSSFSSTIELGKSKGYTAVCHTGNIIFVRNDRVAELGLPETELMFPELLFNYSWIK